MAFERNITQSDTRQGWRAFVSSVRGDAIDNTSPDIMQHRADNPGEFATVAEALEAYRADFCFFCPVPQHWFNYEDGEETFDGWRHLDAPLIGNDDGAFQYGEA